MEPDESSDNPVGAAEEALARVEALWKNGCRGDCCLADSLLDLAKALARSPVVMS